MQEPSDVMTMLTRHVTQSENPLTYNLNSRVSTFESPNRCPSEIIAKVIQFGRNHYYNLPDIMANKNFMGRKEWTLAAISILLDLDEIDLVREFKISSWGEEFETQTFIHTTRSGKIYKIVDADHGIISLENHDRMPQLPTTKMTIGAFCKDLFANNGGVVPHKDDPVRFVEKTKCLCVLMGLHERLGKESLFFSLNPQIIEMIICDFYAPIAGIGRVEFEAMRRGIILPGMMEKP